MADSKIPVEIEVRLDERSVGVSMESLKSRVKTQGREIGKSLSGAFSDISFMSDAVMKAEREKDKFLKKQLDADRTFNNAIRSEAKKTADAQIAEQRRAAAELERVRKSLGLNVMGQAPIKLFGSINDAMKRTEEAAKKQITIWEKVNAPLKKVALLTTELTRAFFGLSLAITGVGLPAIIGVKFLKELEDAKMGVAGIVTSMMSVNGVALTAEQGISVADNAIKELTKSAHKYGLSVSDVVTTFRAITASGTGAKMTLGEIRDLATIGTLAVKGIGLDSKQVVQEVRDLVAGGIQPSSSTLATALGLRDKDIKAAKDSAEGLYKFLIGKLQGFADVASYARDKTMSGVLDSITIKIQAAFADEKLFGGLKDFLKRVSDSIGTIDKLTGDIKLTNEFKEMAEGYLWFIGAIGTLIKSVVFGLGDMLVWIKKIKDEFGAVGNAAEWAAGAVFTAWLVLPKKIIASLTPLSGFFTGFGTNAAVASTTAFSAQWAKSASGFQKVGLVLGTALRAGVVAGLTGFITYELTKEIIESNDELKKFSLQLVGGFLIAGSKITEVFEKSVAWVTYLIEKSMDVMKRGIKGILDAASSAAKFVGLGDISSRFSGASAAIDINPVSPEETRDKSLSNATEKHKKYVSELIGTYNDLTYRMTDTGKAQQKINENQLKSTNAYLQAGAAMDALGKSFGTTAAKQKAYKEDVDKINSNLKTFIDAANEQKKAFSDPEQIANIDKQIAAERKQANEALGLAKVKYEASMVNKKAVKEAKAALKDALKDALTAENIFAEKQDTLVREGAKTYIEAYNDKIAKIKEFAEKNGESIKWEERRNEAYKTVSDYLTQHNAQLNKESEQREANTTATLKYGAAVETSGAALLMEQYAREGFLESGFKELALINVLAQSRNDLSKIHEKSVKEQIDSQKELDELVAESSLIFLENEKQKSEFKMQETLKRINAEREEAKKSLELNLKLRMSAGPLSPQEYENYLETKEAINKSFMDREETTRNIFNQRVKNAELKDAKETVDKIEGTFKEAFMNIAENGVSGWRGMLDKFKSDFKKNIIEYIYKELAKPFVLNVIAQVTGAMGMSGVSQAASSMARATGAGSSIYNAYSAGSSIMGAAGQGLYGTAYGQFATSGLGTALGLSHPASLMGPTVTGEALGGLTTLGTALPYVTAALVIADAVGLFGEGGGPQQGQYGSLGSEGYKSSFTMSGGDALGNQALAEVAYGQAATLLKMAGKDIAGLTIGQGYKLDPEGSAAGLAYRNISLNGRTITGGTFDGNNGAQWVGGSGDAEGAATYLAKLTSSEIEAIANTLNDAKLNGIIASLKKDFDDLADGMARYQTAQALQKGLLGAILSDEEKQKRHLAEVTEYLNKAFADINMAVPTTTEEFRKLIDGVDLTTVAGQTLLTQLGAMGDSFLFVVERAKAAQAQQEEYTNRLAVLQGTTTEQRLAREKELAGALTDGNKAILNQIYALEDHNAIIEKQKEAYQSLSETITTMVDAIKAQNGALKASQSGWQREYGGVDVQGAAERVAAAMGMSAGSVRGMSEADLRSLALSQSQTTTTTDKYADVSKEAMTEALRSGFMATSDALADAVRGGVLFDKLPALLDPFLKPLALNTDDAFQYVANHILSSWDAIMGDGGSGAGKTLAEIVDQFVQGQDLPTSHRVLAGKETTSNFDKLKQDWDDLIAAAAESAKAGAEAAGRMAEEAKKAADAAAAAAKEAEDAFRQLAESVESVFQKYQDNIKKSRIDGMTSQEKVSYFTNQSAQALAALSGGTIQDSETLLKLHDDYIESVMNQYGVELEALEEQFKVTTDLLQTVVDIKGWLDKIKLGALSPLNPQQKLEESRRQYETTLAAAQGGDIAARQNLTAVAEEYLSQAQSYYASSEDYANIFTNVLAQIGALSEPTKTTAEILAQIEGQDKLFNTQANALRERMIVALETGQNRLVDALGSMKADFIAALGQASALAKAASAPPAYASQPYSTSDSPAAKDLVLAAVSSINPGFDYAGAAASNPALIEAWGKDLGIPGYAKGGLVSPGWAMVGEQGPELINFSQPGRVYTADQTSAAINGGNEEYLQQVISELQALIRQNGAASQAMIAELQAVKAELEDLRARTRLKEAA